jgi:hypothetical protein
MHALKERLPSAASFQERTRTQLAVEQKTLVELQGKVAYIGIAVSCCSRYQRLAPLRCALWRR